MKKQEANAILAGDKPNLSTGVLYNLVSKIPHRIHAYTAFGIAVLRIGYNGRVSISSSLGKGSFSNIKLAKSYLKRNHQRVLIDGACKFNPFN